MDADERSMLLLLRHLRSFRPCWWTQPQRDMLWLHRLLYDHQQLLAQLVQVHLLAQRCTESCYDLGCIILPSVEAPVDDPLDATAQWLEQGVDGQRGNDQHHRLL